MFITNKCLLAYVCNFQILKQVYKNSKKYSLVNKNKIMMRWKT
jgi:hypothetical protein